MAPQHDYSLANASGAVFRGDANDALSAIATLNSGATAPATTFAYMLWADTTSGLLKQRNAANSAWIDLFTLADPSATDAVEGLAEYATDAEAATGTATNRALTPANATAALLAQGVHTIFVPAAAMTPTVSNGCASLAKAETTAGRPDMVVLDFDDAADEHAQFQVAFPKSWDEGTVTFQVFWTSTATDTDGVAWGLQGVGRNDTQTLDVAYGTAVVVTDSAASAAELMHRSSVSSALTIASAASEGLTVFRIFRDVSDAADTMAEDARLIGVQLFYTVNLRNDA